MEKRLIQIVEIFTVIMLVTFFFQIAEAGRIGSSCDCYNVGECMEDDDGVMWRYYQCMGSCYDYSGWKQEPRCYSPTYEPRKLFD